MNILIIFLPLFNFLYLLNIGRFLKEKGAIHLSIFSLLLSFCLSSYFLIFNVFENEISDIFISYTWFSIDLLDINWTFQFDTLTLLMSTIVTFISLIVHIYSIEYMQFDFNLIKFLSFLSLFTFFMLFLISSENFIQLFLGWEGVGLTSYLLINFWSTRIQANKSAIKAILVNRVGDFGLLISIIIIYYNFKSLDFGLIFALIYDLKNITINFLTIKFNALNLLNFFLLIGIMGKSAQFLLHTWLADAMEGPTPVSALIHAATMVTVGIFVLIRCSPIIEYSKIILLLLIIIGIITNFFGSINGIFQNDLKKIIAYSTTSQLGYMIISCGISNYTLSLLHLTNHAFFKALLFLSAGSIIHALNNEQDIRKMGGLSILLPFTYLMFLTGSLALIAFPFFSGYYSKDIIFEFTYIIININGLTIYWISNISTIFTVCYSLRLCLIVFFHKPIFSKNFYIKISEPSYYIVSSLIILWLSSIIVGFWSFDWILTLDNYFWINSINMLNYTKYEYELLHLFIKIIPLIITIFGIIFCFHFIFLSKYLFIKNIFIFYKLNKTINQLFFKFLNLKWNIDYIYNIYIINFFSKVGYFINYKFIDKGLLEIIGPLGFIRLFNKLIKIINLIQTGYIYHYIFYIFINLFLFFLIFFDFFSISINILSIYFILSLLKPR